MLLNANISRYLRCCWLTSPGLTWLVTCVICDISFLKFPQNKKLAVPVYVQNECPSIINHAMMSSPYYPVFQLTKIQNEKTKIKKYIGQQNMCKDTIHTTWIPHDYQGLRKKSQLITVWSCKKFNLIIFLSTVQCLDKPLMSLYTYGSITQSDFPGLYILF